MKPRSSLWLTGVLLGCVLAGCAADPPGRTEPPVFGDGGANVNTGGTPAPVFGCPTEQPRPGTRCGRGVVEEDRCSYVLGSCQRGGQTYPDNQDYCCILGLWIACGSDSPCAHPEVPVPDAAQSDAPAHDAGVDAPSDAGGDAGGDDTADAADLDAAAAPV